MAQNSDLILATSPNCSTLEIFSQPHISQALTDLISETAALSGKAFFAALAEHLAKVLGVQYVIVAEVTDWSDTSPLTVKTLAFWERESIGENFEYELKNTPCEQLFTEETIQQNGGLFCIPDALEKRFPDVLGKQCFLGTTLLEKASGRPMGHICFMDDRPMANEALARFVFQFSSSWVAAKLEQHQAECRLRHSEACEREKSRKLEQSLAKLQQAHLALVQSEKMSALGNLVAGVAHEINNPVGFIGGNLQEVKQTVQDVINHLELYQQQGAASETIATHAEAIDLDYLLEDLPKMIASMQVGCDRIRHLSNSLCTFSRTDKDRKVAFDIHQGIDSTLLILKHKLKANERRPAIQVIQSYGDLPSVTCFPGQLNQVFMNLIANAIDSLEDSNQGRSYTEIKDNANCITIRTLQENNQAVVCVRDNGMGMAEAVQMRIFEHGFTTKAVGAGTGLGLAIAQQIVEVQHGGQLTCTSKPGQGAEFAITLPLS